MTDSFVISDAPQLDAITVYIEDYEPGKGMITLVCYGKAWSCYWGAMSGKTTAEFFMEAGTDYIVNRMSYEMAKGKLKYLGRIVDSVKLALKDRKTSPLALPGFVSEN